MGSSVVDVKADEPSDGSTARLTKWWADESHESTAGIKYFDRGTITAHLLSSLWMRIKHIHSKLQSHTQTTSVIF